MANPGGTHKIRRPLLAGKGITSSTGITITAGGMTVTAGNLTLTAGNLAPTAGGVDLTITNSTSTGALATYGYNTIIGSSGSPNYTLAGGVAGRDCYIHCTLATSSQQASVTLGSGVSFYSSDSTAATLRKATFADSNDVLHLFAASTTKWAIVANTGSVTIGTT